ncbi:MAG: hypothetical protein EU533_03375 [Promethearchaeota archaeon]|nr:MAG: hypothetical protein EU533_03375 [Candidatus Lokiarchaeota archaeon]
MQTKNLNIDEVFDEYYEKIRESIKGIEEIIKINFLENNIYHKLSMDNINALNNNVMELLKHMYSPRLVRMKLREIQFDEQEAQETYLE